MFAAAATGADRILDTVMLVLKLETKQRATPALHEYLLETVNKSLSLLERPAEEVATASAEAVSLAVVLSSNMRLKRTFAEFAVQREVENAKQALEGLEAAIDANSKPAYFGREVYAAI